MLSNPFRRRTKTADSQSSKSSTGTRPAITIATDGLSSRGKTRAARRGERQSSRQVTPPPPPPIQTPQMLLPPDSSYRTSLIMPHLTRRFTLLQGPDGTMVTPGAMRAHLRAQRQRARAEGNRNANFLTEQEEDEIIDQMQRQAAVNDPHATKTRHSETTSAVHTFQADGTDGFGGHGAGTAPLRSSSPPSSDRTRSSDRLSSLAASLGDLSASSTLGTATSSGSLFAGRSSQRDHAYLRSLEKPKPAHYAGLGSEAAIEEENEEEEEDQVETNTSDHEQDMPGSFANPARMSRLSAQMVAPEGDGRPFTANAEGRARTPGLEQPAMTRSSTRSPLLTRLSPEAFRRVSTALEEVINMVAPLQHSSENSTEEEILASSYEYTAGSLESTDDEDRVRRDPSDLLETVIQAAEYDPIQTFMLEEKKVSDASMSHAYRTDNGHARNFSVATGTTNGSSRAHDADDEDDESDIARPTSSTFLPGLLSGRSHKAADRSQRSRSPESDTTSFRSANEDAAVASSEQNLAALRPLAPSTPSRSLKQGLGMSFVDSSRTLRPLGEDIGGADMVPSASASGTIRPTSAMDEEQFLVSDQRQEDLTPHALHQTTPRLARDDTATQTPMRQTYARSAKEDLTPRKWGGSHSPVLATRSADLPISRGGTDSPTARLHSSRGILDSPAEGFADDRRPWSPGRATPQPVLSADAIAARSQLRYFPPSTTNVNGNLTMDGYASGFKSTPSTSTASARTAGQTKMTPPGKAASLSNTFIASSALAQVTQGDRGLSRAEPLTVTSAHPAIAFPQPIDQEEQGGSNSTTRLSIAEAYVGARVSSSSGSHSHHDGDGFEDGTDDVWAHVARSLAAEEGNIDDSTRIPKELYADSSPAPPACRNGADGYAGDAEDASDHQSWRPASHVVPSDFEDKGGMTMSQLAQLQASLVRSASQKRPGEGQLRAFEPSVPAIPHRRSSIASTADSVDRATTEQLDPRPGQTKTLPEQSYEGMSSNNNTHSDSYRTPDRSVFESMPSIIPSRDSPPRTPHKRHAPQGAPVALVSEGSSSARFAADIRPTPGLEKSPSSQMTKSSSTRSLKSQVMYDVTTSHRPTSPPLRRLSTSGSHRRNNSSLNNLPTLHDLNLRMHSDARNGRHSSTEQYASNAESDNHSTSIWQRLEGDTSGLISGNGEGNAGMQRINIPHSGSENVKPATGTAQDAAGDSGAIGQQPLNTREETSQATTADASVKGNGGYQADSSISVSNSADQTWSTETDPHLQYDNLVVPKDPAGFSPASAQSGWSGHSGGSANSRRHMNPDMMQDVASQARAATQALKGPHSGDGGPYIPPRKSKSLSKRKSRRNPGKIIGPPTLLSTSQPLTHAHPLPFLDEKVEHALPTGIKGADKKTRPPPVRREASDYSKDPKTMPATLLEEQENLRRTSPFIDSGEVKSDAMSPIATLPSQPILPISQSPRLRAATSGTLRSGSVPATPSSNLDVERDRETGSFGRLMSKMRSRKGSTTNGLSGQQTIIEPFLPPVGRSEVESDATRSVLASPTPGRGTTAVVNPLVQSPSNKTVSPALEGRASPMQALPITHPLSPGRAKKSQLNPSTLSRSASLLKEEAGTSSPLNSPDGPILTRIGSFMRGEKGSSPTVNLSDSTSTPLDRQRSLSSVEDRAGLTRTSPSHLPLVSSRYTERNAPAISPTLPSPGQFGDITSQSIVYEDASDSGQQTQMPHRSNCGSPVGGSPLEQSITSTLLQPNPMRTISNRESSASGSAKADKMLPGTPADARTSPGAIPGSRTSAQNAIVRRTLIFPGDATFVDEKRKSIASIASKRRSRRHGDASALSQTGYLRYAEVRNNAMPDSPQSPTRDLPIAEAAGLAPGETSSPLMSTLLTSSRRSNLRPPSLDGSTRRTSTGAPSSYAGSLYDMYIEGDRGSRDVSAFQYDDEVDKASLLGDRSGAAQRNHIEVTERADGSIVWQIIAGLKGKDSGVRDSRYTAYSGHSRAGSRSSQLSFLQRASMDTSPNPNGFTGATMERTFSGLPVNRDEDSRSLFSRQRSGGIKKSSLDPGASLLLPPVPKLSPFSPSIMQPLDGILSPEGEEELIAEEGADDSGETIDHTTSQRNGQVARGEELSFDLATPAAGVTRIIYSNDVELEQLLEAMARQTDAGTFRFGGGSDDNGGGGAVAGHSIRDTTTTTAAAAAAAPSSSSSPPANAADSIVEPVDPSSDGRSFVSDAQGEVARRVEEEIVSILAAQSHRQQQQKYHHHQDQQQRNNEGATERRNLIRVSASDGNRSGNGYEGQQDDQIDRLRGRKDEEEEKRQDGHETLTTPSEAL